MGGGNELGTKARRKPDPNHAPPAPVPGKRTGTGIGIVDRGTLCDREPDQPGCDPDMNANDRTRLLMVLATVFGSAMDNLRDAVEELRDELLTTVDDGTSWDFWSEILFRSTSVGLIGRATKSLTAVTKRAADVAAEGGTMMVGAYQISNRMAQQIAKVQPAHVTGGLVTMSVGARTTFKNSAHRPKGVSKDNAAGAEFLKLVLAKIAPMTNELVMTGTTTMTDTEIAAMVWAYADQEIHSIAAYVAELRDLLTRYKQQQLRTIGDGRSTGAKPDLSQRQAVFVVDGNRTRMAIVEYYNPIYAKTQPIKGMVTPDGTKPVPWGQPVFVSWIDDDLGGAAIDYQNARVGDLPVVDATGGKTGMPEIDAWGVSL